MATRYLTEPPPSRVGKYRRKPNPEHMKIVRLLQRRPGAWVLAKSFTTRSTAGNFAHNVRHGKYLAFESGKYEAKMVTVDDGAGHVASFDVYARLVGQ